MIVAATAAVAVAGLLFASGARTEELKHYDSSKKDFWLHPPDDWFMGDETQEQKGTHVLNTLPPPTGFTKDEIEATLKQIKLPPGFKIELWATGLPQARQMAWGDNGTLVRRLILGHQRLRRGGRGRQEDGQDHSQGHENADRCRASGTDRAVRRRHRQDLQVRQRPTASSRQNAGAGRSSTTTCRPTFRMAGNI